MQPTAPIKKHLKKALSITAAGLIAMGTASADQERRGPDRFTELPNITLDPTPHIAAHYNSLLLNAIRNEDTPEVRHLIEQNLANPNARNSRGVPALHIAAIQGHTEIVDILIEGGADIHTVIDITTGNGAPQVPAAQQHHQRIANAIRAFDLKGGYVVTDESGLPLGGSDQATYLRSLGSYWANHAIAAYLTYQLANSVNPLKVNSN